MGLHDKEAADRDAGQAQVNAAWDRLAASQGDKGAQARTGWGGGGGGGGSTCFPAHTPILTPNGTAPIASLNGGDKVLAFDVNSNELKLSMILRTKAYRCAPIWEICLVNGDVIETTYSHSFLTSRGWVKAGKLTKGDEIVQISGVAAILAVRKTELEKPVFNLVTADQHNFVAYNCVAHNFTNFRMLRTILYRWLITPTLRPLLSGQPIIGRIQNI